jgi:hypothetical protein
MAAPTFRAAATARGNSTTASVTIPGTVQVDDWGILVVDSGDGMGNPSTPSGWSVILSTTAMNAKSRITIFGRKFVAGDAAPSMTYGVGSNWSVNAVWYSGCDGVGIIGSFTGAGTGTTSTCAAITTTSADNIILSIGVHFAGGAGFAASASASPDSAVVSAVYGVGTFNHGIWIGAHTKAVAGATNTQTITWDLAATGIGGIQISLIPAAPPQLWVPTTDTGATIASWTKTPSGAAGVYAVLADSDPTTYIESATNPSAQVYQTPTFSLQVPADLTSVRVKVSGYMPVGTTGSRLIQLYQSTTLIKQQTISLTGSNVETSVALNSTEAGSMTVTSGQWQNLSVKVTDTAS